VGTILRGTQVELRPVMRDDVNELARIRATPEVYQRWGGGPDVAATITQALADVDVHSLTVVHEGRVVGMIQWSEEADPDYRHANIDIFVEPALQAWGLGRTRCGHSPGISSRSTATTDW
jgi:aminoglycoside 6'-N-acetyltransferase